MENKILNKILKNKEKGKLILNKKESNVIFDIYNFNEEALEIMIKDLNPAYKNKMEALAFSILRKKDRPAIVSDLVSEMVSLKIPNMHSIVFGIMVVLMKKFAKQ